MDDNEGFGGFSGDVVAAEIPEKVGKKADVSLVKDNDTAADEDDVNEILVSLNVASMLCCMLVESQTLTDDRIQFELSCYDTDGDDDDSSNDEDRETDMYTPANHSSGDSWTAEEIDVVDSYVAAMEFQTAWSRRCREGSALGIRARSLSRDRKDERLKV